MLRVPITQAKPGMTLALPVLHPDRPSRVLLRTGFCVDRQTIDILRAHEVASLWIRYPGLEFVGRYITPDLVQARGALAQTVASVVDRMAVDASSPAEYATYRRAVRGFIESVAEHHGAALMIENMEEARHPLVRHTADVCFLSLLMGMRLEQYLVMQRERLPEHRARSIVDLGIAALLHDVGLIAMGADYDRWVEEGCDETDTKWRAHVLVGYERVREHLSPSASAAILHHHQCFDGSGFPSRSGGLEGDAPWGDDIHIYARILFAANEYDRLRFPPGGGPARPPVRVLREMQRAPMVNRIDPVVFRALLSVAPAYPPGTLVTLSTGEEGAVVDWSPADPCRPVVQVLDDGVRLGREDPVRHDLRLRREIEITHTDREDVSKDNFYPRTAGEFDLYVTNRNAIAPLEDAPVEDPPVEDAA
ncbi:MAG: HD domain-containing phosphohydrolase [Planctomycetota bacterium]